RPTTAARQSLFVLPKHEPATNSRRWRRQSLEPKPPRQAGAPEAAYRTAGCSFHPDCPNLPPTADSLSDPMARLPLSPESLPRRVPEQIVERWALERRALDR